MDGAVTARDRVAAARAECEAAALAIVDRKLRVLARADRALIRSGPDQWCVRPGGDGRRRALAVFSGAEIRSLVSEGVLIAEGQTHRLTEAGRARTRRAAAAGDYGAQHQALIAGPGRDPIDAAPVLRRMEPRDHFAAATKWGEKPLAPAPARAAARLARDHELAQRGPRLGVDWTAPPMNRQARGPGAGPGAREAAAFDASRRVEAAFQALGADLAPVVRAFVLEGLGFGALERRFGWPPRSGRVAAAMALAALARHYGER